jgi:hypothetical protein
MSARSGSELIYAIFACLSSVNPKHAGGRICRFAVNQTDHSQKVTVRITNLTSGESYTGRLAITETQQIYVPIEIQRMLKGSGAIRFQILGG